MSPRLLAKRALHGEGDRHYAVEAAIREAVATVAHACFAVLQMKLEEEVERAIAIETLANALDAVDYQPASEAELDEEDRADVPVIRGTSSVVALDFG